MSDKVVVYPSDWELCIASREGLKPCPFCGSGVSACTEQNVVTKNFIASIFCVRCMARVSYTAVKKSEAQSKVEASWQCRV